MRSGNAVIPATAVFLLLLSGLSLTGACNKALCASDVSKCLIQELCQCRPTDGNCSCCKECMLCLGTLWDECCDCVGMCNPKNYSDTPPTSKSTVEELHEPIPSLFRALTEGETQLNWNIVSFPVAEELSHHENLVSFLETLDEAQSQNASVPGNSIHARYDSDKGMCNPKNYSDTPPTSKSTVEELHEPIPSLFRALTEGETQLNWNIVSFPVTEELSHHENLVSFLETLDEAQSQNVSVPGNSVHARYDSDKAGPKIWKFCCFIVLLHPHGASHNHGRVALETAEMRLSEHIIPGVEEKNSIFSG
ncbi:UNVERIFIED_CONTAM: hypothetical protein FKN15_067304 [Acipenser sinensis]